MSFYDNPIVDKASKNSEESVNAVRSLFTQKNGFISRKEDPDYGVDKDVELIIDNQASSKKFAIQIKSVSHANFIERENIKYISLQFKSSRLGYLCRRPPAYGIIIIYDDSTQISYYDYVENIYESLNNQHNSDAWKEIEKPTIYIPITNILNRDSVKSLHRKMVDRHKSNQFLLNAFGNKYNIPVYQDNVTNNEIDFENPQTIAKFLSDNGLKLFNHNDLSKILALLSKLTFSDISKSVELILLASITYCETGNFIDADYFLKKSEIICDFDNDQKNLWSFTRYKTDFALGNFEYNTYLARLEDLSKTISEGLNSIILKVNIIFIKLLISSKEKVFNEILINEIDQVFDLIFKLSIDNEKKYNLINYHSFNLHIYASGLLIDKIGKYQIKKRLNILVPIDQRIIDIKTIINVLGLPTKYTLDALTYANENDNKYIRATSLYQLSFYFFILQSSMFNFDQITPLSEDLELNYKKHIKYSSYAYNEFISLQLYKDAYNALTLTYELLQLYKVCYQDTVGEISIENLSETLNAYCQEFGFKEYQSTVLKTFETKKRTKESDFETFLSSNENNIDQIAQIIISSSGLPQERKENVLVDLNNHQYFYKNRLSKDYELIQELGHTFSTNTYYNEKPNCLIECKKCGFKTELKDDIEKLVELINNHECKK